MKAILDGDLVVGFAVGDVSGGVELPEGLRGMPPADLRFRGATVIDATVLTRFWIDQSGTKHAEQLNPEWEELACKLSDTLRHDGSQWIVVPKTQVRRNELHAHAARRRWAKEAAGVTIAGLSVPTDERTQAVLNGAYSRAKADPSYAISKWKVGPGAYVALSNEQIVAIAELVSEHIQNCFVLNAEIDDKIDTDEITVTAQIDGFFDAA